MALTDNTFTAAEFESAAAANPAIIEQVKTALSKQEYTILNKDERATYETNLQTRVVGEYTSRVAGEVEKTVEEITGIKKANPQEKWTDYYTRAMKEVTGLSKAQATELAALKGKSDITAAERERIQELENVVKAKDQEVQTIKSDFASRETRFKLESKINSSAPKVEAKFKKDAGLQEAIQIVASQVKSDILAKSKMDDHGTMIIFGDDGKPLFDNLGGYKTFEVVYAERMEKWIDKGKTQTGAGGDPTVPDDVTPSQFKNRLEVSNYLAAKGLVGGTKAFSDEWEKLGADKLPLR